MIYHVQNNTFHWRSFFKYGSLPPLDLWYLIFGVSYIKTCEAPIWARGEMNKFEVGEDHSAKWKFMLLNFCRKSRQLLSDTFEIHVYYILYKIIHQCYK